MKAKRVGDVSQLTLNDHNTVIKGTYCRLSVEIPRAIPADNLVKKTNEE